MNQPNSLRSPKLAALATVVGLAFGACAADIEQAEDDEAFASYCESSGHCDESSSSALWEFLTGAAKIILVSDFDGDVAAATEAFFDNPEKCPYPEKFSHFIDLTEVIDGEPTFTSVQDFTINDPEKGKIDPMDVALTFRRDWLPSGGGFWDGGTTAFGGLGHVGDGTYQTEIRPLGLSIVSISMSVKPPVENPSHPRLENPSRDSEWNGQNLAWQAGVEIDMGPSGATLGFGSAFVGTMYVLVRRLDDDSGVHVREMWYHTKALSPVVGHLPVDNFTDLDPDIARLNIAAFLHLSATQGCAVPRGTGYPGMIRRFESGEY